MLYTVYNNLTLIKFSKYYRLNILSTRSHVLTIYPLPSSININQYSFFVNSVILWNLIPYDVLSAPLTFLSTNLNHFCFDCNCVFTVVNFVVFVFVCCYVCILCMGEHLVQVFFLCNP